MKWLIEHWLAIMALLIAVVGGVPGVLKIIQYFRPISVTGSIKFYTTTKSTDPPEDGLLLAITLVNEGTKNLVWRNLASILQLQSKKIKLKPKVIPNSLSVLGQEPASKDLLYQQSILPGNPFNGYILLSGAPGDLTGRPIAPSQLYLLFELESGKIVKVNLPITGANHVQESETFPSHMRPK